MQVEIQRQRTMMRMVREVTGGLPKEFVVVGFGSASGWYRGPISRKSVFLLP